MIKFVQQTIRNQKVSTEVEIWSHFEKLKSLRWKSASASVNMDDKIIEKQDQKWSIDAISQAQLVPVEIKLTVCMTVAWGLMDWGLGTDIGLWTKDRT